MTGDLRKSFPYDSFPHIELELAANDVPELFGLLQRGFIVSEIRPGSSLASFLTERLGLSHEYIHGHISTIFLDGMPVDDLDSAVIRKGATLALSSALPGLVGATMRQGGALASLRNSITYRATAADLGDSSDGDIFLHLKLFNIVMHELGPSFLQQGVLVKRSELREFLDARLDLLQKCGRILLDGRPVAAGKLSSESAFEGEGLIMLSIRANGGS